MPHTTTPTKEKSNKIDTLWLFTFTVEYLFQSFRQNRIIFFYLAVFIIKSLYSSLHFPNISQVFSACVLKHKGRYHSSKHTLQNKVPIYRIKVFTSLLFMNKKNKHLLIWKCNLKNWAITTWHIMFFGYSACGLFTLLSDKFVFNICFLYSLLV